MTAPNPAAIPASVPASIQVLEPLNLPLFGSRLIEASAGTGKTWTIAALYVRLVLCHGGTGMLNERPYDPSQLLVLTFTVAATRELSNRIRERLVEAAACFRGHRAPEDPLLASLLDEYPPGPARDVAGWRLSMAAQAMDDAAVLTIDAWCQRMLREHAFDSGCLFDEELRVDDSALLADAARDYWRQHVYPLSGSAWEEVLAAWSGVAGLRADVDALTRLNALIEPDDRKLGQVLDDVTRRREAAMQELKVACRSWIGPMRAWVDAQEKSSDKGKLRIADARRWLTELETWSTGDSLDEPALTSTAWERLTPAGLLENRKAQITIPVEFQQFAGLRPAIQALPSMAPAIRLHAAQAVRARVLQLKAAEGSYGFADMLERLGQALAGSSGARLRARILEQYPVAMIDEFQDTSPLQCRLFEQIYGAAALEGKAGLFLIGDPKQSIYAFRGADIRSYLTARRATAGRHYALTTNFRSTEGVVAAVNGLFQGAEERSGPGAFRFRGAGREAAPAAVLADAPSEIPFIAVNAFGRDERFVSADGPVPAMTLVHDARLSNGRDAQALFAGHCAERIVAMLGDAQCGFAGSEGFKRLRPADIAVLVRTGAEAQSVQAALRKRGLASVYLSDKDSVFGGAEAADLLLWLQAVAEPTDGALVRAAFATSTLDHSLAELANWAHDDEALERRAELMRQLNVVWRRQGVLSMLRQTLHRLGLPGRWLASTDGGGERRLTNFLHLAELLQTASSSLDSHQALIRWLAQEIEAVEAGADEHLVRLESDADLVQIVTIHKSKGLEYSVVLVPFVCSFRPADVTKAGFISVPREPDGREIVFDPDAQQLAAADEERLQEDIRLLYVALTRARHALWIGVATLCRGTSRACVFTRSAFGNLMAGEQPTAEGEIEPLLRAFAQRAAPHVVVLQAPEVAAVTMLSALRVSGELPPLLEAEPYRARFERNWAIGSFSGLVKDVGMSPGARLLAPVGKDHQEDLVDASSGVVTASALVDVQAAPWHRFPRGAMPGNFLHEQLEWLAQERFAMEGDPTLADRLYRRCERQGRGHRAADVVEWLRAICAVNLPPLETSLARAERIVSEMEFWFPADGLSAGRLDVLCKEHLLSGRPRPDLPPRELHGMLMGFADLVVEHQGRYWVLDYKSNALGTRDSHYDRDALEAAMAAHRYEVQAVIYLLALHRLLKSRLGKRYVPEKQLGGAVYLFLRGVQGPEAGCYLVPPSVALLDALDQEMVRAADRAADKAA